MPAAGAAARLLIVDYLDQGRYWDQPLKDAGGPFLLNPPKRDDLAGRLQSTGWSQDSFRDLGAEYQRWYVGLVEKTEAKRAAIKDLVGAEGYDHIHGLYGGLLKALQAGRLGGAIVEAKRQL